MGNLMSVDPNDGGDDLGVITSEERQIARNAIIRHREVSAQDKVVHIKAVDTNSLQTDQEAQNKIDGSSAITTTASSSSEVVAVTSSTASPGDKRLLPLQQQPSNDTTSPSQENLIEEARNSVPPTSHDRVSSSNSGSMGTVTETTFRLATPSVDPGSKKISSASTPAASVERKVESHVTDDTTVFTAQPELSVVVASSKPSKPAGSQFDRLHKILKPFASEKQENTNKQIVEKVRYMATDKQDYIINNALRMGIKPTILFTILCAPRLEKPARGQPQFVILCVDNALCQEISDICEQLREAWRKANVTPLPEVATLMAHMQNEATNEQLNKKSDIIIATPGKLLDLHRRGQVSMSAVKKLVLDQLDCFLLYADDPDIQAVLKLLRPGHHVIALTCRVTPRLKQRWKDVVPASTIHVPNMIILPDTQHSRIGKLSKYVIWKSYSSSASPMSKTTQVAEYVHKMTLLRRASLVIANYKVTVDAIMKAGRLHRAGDFARHRAELPDGDERYNSLQGFKEGTYKIMISTRRSIYGTSFPFLPIFILAEVPKSYDELLYLIQWYESLIMQDTVTSLREGRTKGSPPAFIIKYDEDDPSFQAVAKEFQGNGGTLPHEVLICLK